MDDVDFDDGFKLPPNRVGRTRRISISSQTIDSKRLENDTESSVSFARGSRSVSASRLSGRGEDSNIEANAFANGDSGKVGKQQDTGRLEQLSGKDLENNGFEGRGRGIGRGRGGIVREQTNRQQNENYPEKQVAGSWEKFSGETNGYEGRGRGRGRGRGGARGQCRNYSDNETDDDADFDRRNCRGRGRGRGGIGEPTNRRQNEDEPEKPRELYVPVERIADDDLFTTTITSGVNFVKFNDIEVNVTGAGVPEPIISFASSGLRPHLLENIKKSNYVRLTPIQKYAIPIILSGRDLMGCAQTGSGKTAAFLLPTIHKILESNNPPMREGNTAMPNIVIVSPTRELTIQIHEQAKKFAHNSAIKTVVIYGGTAIHHQRNQVSAGCHILVATPGRLIDFLTRGHVGFSAVQFFVLDEADRMLDMGFLPAIEQMLGHETMKATGERQTLMFSATFPEEIQHLAGKFLHNYAFVTVGVVGSASNDVEQNFFQVTRFDKRKKLLEMLKHCKERTLVFVETKRNADFLATLLCENEISTTSIHGDRLQSQREEALWEFKKGIRNILVATGVAARGLDIEGVQHVINYDLPKSVDEYVHRIGRTGRVGNRGKATSFYDSAQDGGLAGQLANILRQAGQKVPQFLKGDGYAYLDNGDNGNFGGRDIRGDDFGRGQNYNEQPAEIQDEDW